MFGKVKPLAKQLLFIFVSLTTVLAQAAWFTVGHAGAEATPPELVSKATNGDPANDLSFGGIISADGRYVAFNSHGTNLGTQGADPYGDAVYVHDRVTGQTVLASVDSNGQQENGTLSGFTLSGDGRHVAFMTNANNMDPDSHGIESGKFTVYIRDLDTGITVPASVDANGQRIYPFGAYGSVSLSYDGSVAAFMSNSQGGNEDGTEILPSIYIKDMVHGTVKELPNEVPQALAISGDGNRIVYSQARLMPPTVNSQPGQLMVYDRSTDTSMPARFYTDGSVDDRQSFTFQRSMSYDGRYVLATGTGCGDNNTCLFRSDIESHVTKKLVNVSFCGSGSGLSADGALAVIVDSFPGEMLGDCPNTPQAYVYDVATDTRQAVSNNALGMPADAEVQEPAFSADGTVIAFTTAAPNFGVSNSQVFVTTNSMPTNPDTLPPALGTPAWSNNPKPTTGTTTLTVPATDDLSGIAQAEYFIGDTDPGQGNGATMTLSNEQTGSGGAITSADLTATFGTDFPTGVYKISVRAQDTAGNWSTPVSDYLVVYDPSGPKFTGKRTIVPHLSNGDVLPGLISSSQTDTAKFGFSVKYNNQGQINANSDMQFSYSTGTHCNNPSKAANCHDLNLNATQISWLTTQGTNNSTGIFQGTANVTIDSTTTQVTFRVTGVDGERLSAAASDQFQLQIFNLGDNPNSATPLYRVNAADIARGNIKIQ